MSGQEAREEAPNLMARLADSLRQKKAEREARHDEFTWDDLCAEGCPENCEADHKGEV